MKSDFIKKSINLFDEVGIVLMATADPRGTPHMVTAKGMTLTPGNQPVLTSWFCLKTLENLRVNPRIALVVWDERRDLGYQLTGICEEIRDLATLNGYSEGEEEQHSMPQVERQIVMCVEEITEFRHSPHSNGALARPLG